nr:MAG TPA: hypothetical protein [Caudoviricetes sp.]
MSETFLYEVVPHRPIRGLVSGKAITRPMVLLLDKEDVIECLKKATVYRRFSSNKREKVTLYTVDRFHRKDFISEASFRLLQEYEAKKERSEQGLAEAVKLEKPDTAQASELSTSDKLLAEDDNLVKQEEVQVDEEAAPEEVEEPSESESIEEEIEEEITEEVEEAVEKKENEEPSGSDDSLEEAPVSETQQQRPRAKAKARTKNRR